VQSGNPTTRSGGRRQESRIKRGRGKKFGGERTTEFLSIGQRNKRHPQVHARGEGAAGFQETGGGEKKRVGFTLTLLGRKNEEKAPQAFQGEVGEGTKSYTTKSRASICRVGNRIWEEGGAGPSKRVQIRLIVCGSSRSGPLEKRLR